MSVHYLPDGVKRTSSSGVPVAWRNTPIGRLTFLQLEHGYTGSFVLPVFYTGKNFDQPFFLLEQKGEFLHLLGGKPEEGENPYQTLHRELTEEIGPTLRDELFSVKTTADAVIDDMVIERDHMSVGIVEHVRLISRRATDLPDVSDLVGTSSDVTVLWFSLREIFCKNWSSVLTEALSLVAAKLTASAGEV